MKPKKLRLIILILIFPLSFGCDLIKTEADTPGISIYKTKGDYFNYITVGMKGDEVFRIYHYYSDSKMIVNKNDTIYRFRWQLPNGYILDAEADERYDVFLNITCKEQFYREMRGVPFTYDSIRRHIIDKDPYLEYYRFRKDLPVMDMDDSLKIRQIVLDGEIDKYFEKVK
jgi:hypothetical protein